MLRSISDLKDYAISATDGAIGRVKDFYFDDESWGIRYLIVDTSNWMLGHKVLIPAQSIKNVNWFDANVYVNLTMQAVKNSPLYDDALTLADHIIKAT